MIRLCKVNECGRVHHAKGLCRRHYVQYQKHGKILKRTLYDPNEIVIKGDVAEIILYDREGERVAKAIIDAEDVPKVSGHKWRLNKIRSGHYCTTEVNGRHLYLQHLIMGVSEGIDHINRDGLDNRKVNLRECTHQQNDFNKGPQSNNASGYKGVSKDRGRWVAQIQKDGKNRCLGFYDSPEEAALAYNEEAERLFGEFAYLNQVE